MTVRRVVFLVVVLVLPLCYVAARRVSYNAEGLLPRIYLTVYYESKSPESKSFIIEQLQPAIEMLHEFVILQLVPFGKSKRVPKSDRFICPRGPSECLGNMVQDCALVNMVNRPDADMLGYVACEMETTAGTEGDLYCVRKFDIPVIDVERCVKWGEGFELQLRSERLTKAVKPRSIPTITIDRVFNQTIQNSAQVDLIGTLCSILNSTRACGQHYNKIALEKVLKNSIISNV